MESSKLQEAAGHLGISLGEDTCQKLIRYYEMVIEKNKVMNLTAITEEDEFLYKHFVDSLSIVQVLGDATKKQRVIDVGTGAGFPGLVLKIAFPELDITLFDSLKKRLSFLDEVIGELGLDKTGVRTLHGRAEDLGQNPAHRESYDLVLARAVANMSTLSEYCLPLAAVGGRFIAYKTEDDSAACEKAIRLLGGHIGEVKEFTLPGTDFRRTFITLEKVKETPKKYPRKAGTPAKEPL